MTINSYITRGYKVLSLCLMGAILSGLTLSLSAAPATISKRVHSVIVEVQAILYPEHDASVATQPSPDLNKAKAIVAKLDNVALSDYEQALVHQLSAAIAWLAEDYQTVYDSTLHAWQLNALPARDQLDMEKRLAQVALYREQWREGLAHFESWQVNREIYNQSVEPPQRIHASSEDFLLMAQGSYQAELWHKTIYYSEYHRKLWRTESHNNATRVLPESWLQLKLGALLNAFESDASPSKTLRLADQPALNKAQLRAQIIAELTVLCQHYPTKSYWRQLAFIHLHNIDQQSASIAKQRRGDALAALNSAYMSGMINTEQDILWMVQLFMHVENYAKAVMVLEENFKRQFLPRSNRNIQLLASNALAARDYEKAKQALLQLKAQDPSADIDEQLTAADTMLNQVYRD